MQIVLLHLSDIHIKTMGDPILKRGDAIAAAVYRNLPGASHLFIVISGDIAFSGTEDQYAWAKELIRNIRQAIATQNPKCRVSVLVAPGNHDCNFDKDSRSRALIIEGLLKESDPRVDADVIETCIGVQEEYRAFRGEIEAESADADDGLWRTKSFALGAKVVQFDVLNVAWASKNPEYLGKLLFPVAQYTNEVESSADVRFVVLHHPFHWLQQGNYRPLRQLVRRAAHIVITGHEHVGNVGAVTDADSDSSAFVEGCVLQSSDKNLSDSSFNVILVDLTENKFSSTRYLWNGELYSSQDEGSWRSYEDLPVKRNQPYSLRAEFSDTLDDPGAPFRHPGKEKLTLGDFFVYPDLSKSADPTKTEEASISATALRNPAAVVGALIEGDEKSGRTSLMRQLFRDYHDRGLVPVLIDGAELVRAKGDAVESVIARAIRKQYQNLAPEAFSQLPRVKVVVLVDDFDETKVRASPAQRELLRQLKERTDHLILTVGELFGVSDLAQGLAEDLKSFARYKIKPFGYALRSRLIAKWIGLSGDNSIGETELASKCHSTEVLAGAVMPKNLVPCKPLYVLILLQGVATSSVGDFKEGALGHYYHFLLSQAALAAGVQPEELTALFAYCCQLAWYMHSNNLERLSLVDLKAFNEQYSARWHTVDLSDRLRELVDSSILIKEGNEYRFRYPYIYFYFKAQYLSETLKLPSTKDYVARCCQHLYVRDYANTVLFLAHHSNDDFVLASIVDALKSIFPDDRPIEFGADTSVIGNLIEAAPNLPFLSPRSPEANREQRDKIKDRAEEQEDTLLDTEETEKTSSLAAQLAALFKTMEILGHVLKNQYAKIERERRTALIDDLLAGPLRALRNFYSWCVENPNGLIAGIEQALSERSAGNEDTRKKIARKVVATFVVAVSMGFIARAADSVRSPALLEDVGKVVSNRKTLALNLIDLAVALEGPGALPRQKIKNVNRLAKGNLAGEKVLHMLLVHRLYMFKTKEIDMQWLFDELGMDLEQQHAIAYSSKNVDRLG